MTITNPSPITDGLSKLRKLKIVTKNETTYYINGIFERLKHFDSDVIIILIFLNIYFKYYLVKYSIIVYL